MGMEENNNCMEEFSFVFDQAKYILCNLAEIILILDFQRLITYVTPFTVKKLGFQKVEFTQRSIYDFVHPEDSLILKKALERLDNEPAEIRFTNADGTYLWLEIVCQKMLKGTEDIGVIISTREISKRKELERNLRKQRDELQMILDNIAADVFYFVEPSVYGYVNNSSAKFLGITPEKARNQSLYDFFERDKADFFVRINERVFAEKQKVEAEYQHRDKNGRVKIFSYKFSPKLNDAGDVQFIMCVAHDITEIRINQARLEESNRELKQLALELDCAADKISKSEKLLQVYFEEAYIGMAISDLNGKFIKANKALCKMLGYKKNELLKKNFRELTHPEDLKKSIAYFDKIHSGKINKCKFEKRYITKYGETVYVNICVSVAKNDYDEPLHHIISIEDITNIKTVQNKVKEQEDELKRSKEEIDYNRLKTKFFINISHELRTPLNIIFSSLQVLDLFKVKNPCLKDDDKFTRYIKLIKQNSYRLLRLINNLIDITKIGGNSFRLQKQNYDIVKIIRDITFSTQDYITNGNRELEFYSNIEQKVMAIDPFNIERILLNLVSNAVKYSEEGAKITIRLEDRGPNVIISVKDTGFGIKEDQLEIIFEHFRQCDESLQRLREGSGIGLSIVKSLVELHGGRVWVESSYGAGSEFFVELPVIQLAEKLEEKNSYQPQELFEKIDIEFSDIYNL